MATVARMMKELAKNLIEKANLTEEQAQHAAEAMRGFLEQKLPDAMKGSVLGFLTQERVEGVLNKASDVVAGLTGEKTGDKSDTDDKSAK